MRILIIHSFYRASLPSGENQVVLNQVSALQDAGYEVALWGPSSPEDPGLPDEIRTGVRLLANSGADPSSEIRRFDPDLIHIHNLFPNIATRWMYRSNPPILMTVHNYRTVCANGLLLRQGRPCEDCLPDRRVMGVVHACYKDSRLASLVAARHQVQLIKAIKRGVNTLIFPSKFQKAIVEPLAEGVPTVHIPNYVPKIEGSYVDGSIRSQFLYLGRLTQEKGLESLLDIWPKGVPLVIAGDGPLRHVLEIQASDANLNVDFAGQVDGSERARLLSTARALILPSLTYEVDPLVVAEALSAGVPCIVRDHTAPAQLARVSPAVRTFSEATTLEDCLTELRSTDFVEEALDLYNATWSQRKWLKSFSDVSERLVG